MQMVCYSDSIAVLERLFEVPKRVISVFRYINTYISTVFIFSEYLRSHSSPALPVSACTTPLKVLVY